MSITEIALKVRETGDDSEVDFDFGFQIYDDGDIVVYKITTATGEKTLQVLGVDYTVAIDTDSPGGTVTYTTAPASTEESYIICAIQPVQATTFLTNGKFTDEQVENALDRLTMLVQQLEEMVGRCLKVDYEFDNPELLPEFSTTAGYLYWNGTSFELSTPS
ncbi:hypothetical protein [Candidatus Magnetobacterium casense]|uniref:Uncharacterized protein n=1 Tax=Candidatus Magnetobacterium casense TaxID=1455061 RepID=A0ABS6RWN2_9BACT|nr:hypothetical protein [Candidatus Magnetobacterium casensis]MBV6341031.1 hypothetical protein [Candidatus Magnetobacterium casensis]